MNRGCLLIRRDSLALCLIAIVAALLPASVAQAAGAGCDGGRWPLASIQAHFNGTLPALASGDALAGLGAPTQITLSPQAEVTFPHPPGRPAKADPAYGAIVKLGPQPAATYQVTVSGGAWVDLVEGGELVKPTAYIRRNDCPGIDKSIRFKTNGGPLTIQISGSYGQSIKLEAKRAE